MRRIRHKLYNVRRILYDVHCTSYSVRLEGIDLNECDDHLNCKCGNDNNTYYNTQYDNISYDNTTYDITMYENTTYDKTTYDNMTYDNTTYDMIICMNGLYKH